MSLTRLELATSSDGTTWDNPSLFDKLLRSEPETGFWSIWHWDSLDPPLPLVEITLLGPQEFTSSRAAQRLLKAAELQLHSALTLFASERGWPLPNYKLNYRTSSLPDWSYRIALTGSQPSIGEVIPNKILALGDASQLASLLGLESVDPFLGLPAKWITRSQLEAARQLNLHTFESSGLLAAHALHTISADWSHSYGILELQAWLSKATPEHANLLVTLMPTAIGLFSQTVKALIGEELWLPHPSRMLELFLSSWSQVEPEEDGRADLILESIRKEIVPQNITRLADSDGVLYAIEWRGEPFGDDGTQKRLISRLEAALLSVKVHPDTTVIVLTDPLCRRELRQALHHTFPHLYVLSWEELPSWAQVHLLATVDSRFEVDPSPWRYASFEVESC